MKSLILPKEEKKEEKPFPKLLVHRDDSKYIVLSPDGESATVVHGGDVGHEFQLSRGLWRDFYGTIQLSNE